jgi:hypothetical protein
VTQPISRTTPKAIGLWDREQSRRHVVNMATYAAGTDDALCLGCKERLERGQWLKGTCPGPKTSERSA